MKFFRIVYPTGRITINIGGFFSLAKVKAIDELLKFAKKHCSEEQRTQLLKDLEEAKLRIAYLLNNNQGRDGVNVAFIKPFSYDPYWQPREQYVKDLSKQVKKLDKSIARVQNMVWLGA